MFGLERQDVHTTACYLYSGSAPCVMLAESMSVPGLYQIKMKSETKLLALVPCGFSFSEQRTNEMNIAAGRPNEFGAQLAQTNICPSSPHMYYDSDIFNGILCIHGFVSQSGKRWNGTIPLSFEFKKEMSSLLWLNQV